jgi:hypothetical protein
MKIRLVFAEESRTIASKFASLVLDLETGPMASFCGPRSKLTPAYTVKKRDLHLDAFVLWNKGRGLDKARHFW